MGRSFDFGTHDRAVSAFAQDDDSYLHSAFTAADALLEAGFGVFAEAGVDAGGDLDAAAEEPEEVGEAVEVGDDRGLDEDAALDEADGGAFGTAADGAGHLVGGGLGVGSGE
jgi:hypothetical protein